MSSGTTAEPIKPVAPVTKIRMIFSPSRPVPLRVFTLTILTSRHYPATNGGSLRIAPKLSEASSGCKEFFLMATKAPEFTDRKLRADAQRNRERILEVAKQELTR